MIPARRRVRHRGDSHHAADALHVIQGQGIVLAVEPGPTKVGSTRFSRSRAGVRESLLAPFDFRVVRAGAKIVHSGFRFLSLAGPSPLLCCSRVLETSSRTLFLLKRQLRPILFPGITPASASL